MPIESQDPHTVLQALLDNPEYIHYLGLVSPPRFGVRECLATLEFTHFPPSTELNEEFCLALFDWHGTIWTITSIPTAKAHLMEEVAKQCGLRITEAIPVMFSGGGQELFPYRCQNMRTLETISGHPAYRNDPETNRVLESAECEAIHRITGR